MKFKINRIVKGGAMSKVHFIIHDENKDDCISAEIEVSFIPNEGSEICVFYNTKHSKQTGINGTVSKVVYNIGMESEDESLDVYILVDSRDFDTFPIIIENEELWMRGKYRGWSS